MLQDMLALTGAVGSGIIELHMDEVSGGFCTRARYHIWNEVCSGRLQLWMCAVSGSGSVPTNEAVSHIFLQVHFLEI